MKITLGPLPYNWPHEMRQDFYLRVADEADIDTVCLGETVCSKRIPLAPAIGENIYNRLKNAGKNIVLSTLVLPKTKAERDYITALSKQENILIEAGDMTSVAILSGKPHVIGPFIPANNEDSLAVLQRNGAIRACLPVDLPGDSMALLAKRTTIPLETHVFGYAPLAISARCFSARATDKNREHCQFSCARNNGRPLCIHTLDHTPFLRTCGPMVFSNKCTSLLREIPAIRDMGMASVRMQPEENGDPVRIAALIRDIVENRMAPDEGQAHLAAMLPETDFCNGFFYHRAGHEDITP